MDFKFPKCNPAVMESDTMEKIHSKLIPYNNGYILEKAPFNLEDLRGCSYLSKAPISEFKEDPDLRQHQIAGLHTYGGFHMFFRPDLWEVMLLFTQLDVCKRLDDIESIYCTTVPCSDVYDPVTDRHRAATTFLIKW